MAAQQDLVMTGPFLQQILASSLLVLPTGQTSLVTLGAMAASSGSGARGANGLPTAGLVQRLTDVKLATGLPLTASTSSSTFGLTFAAATGATVVSSAANNSSIAPVGALEIVLPSNYVAGQNVTVNITQNIVIGAGTVSTKTLTVTGYLQTDAGASGSNLIATAAGTLTNTQSTLSFVITGTTLVPGSRLLILMTGALTETATSNVTFLLSKITLS